MRLRRAITIASRITQSTPAIIRIIITLSIIEQLPSVYLPAKIFERLHDAEYSGPEQYHKKRRENEDRQWENQLDGRLSCLFLS